MKNNEPKKSKYSCYGCGKGRTVYDPFIGLKKNNLPLCKECHDWLKWAFSEEDV